MPADEHARLETEYRAVVEEILELRGDDGRIQSFLRSIADPGALADIGLLARSELRAEGPAARGGGRHRAARARAPVPARAPLADADPPADPRRRQHRHGEAAREFLLRKQMDSIRKELGEDDASVVEEYRKKIEAAGMPEDVREQADKGLRGSSGWARARRSRR